MTDSSSGVYDAGPGWDRPVPGTVVAVGPADWLVDVCDAQYLHCRFDVVDVTTGSARASRGRLVAVNPRTGRTESLGVGLPAVDQVAIRP